MDKQVAYEGYTGSYNNKEEISRRKFLVVGAVGGAGLMAGGVLIGRNMNGNHEPQPSSNAGAIDVDPEEAVAPEQVADVAAPAEQIEQNSFSLNEIANSVNPNIHAGEMSELAEKSSYSLERRFQMSTDEIQSSEEYIETFEDLFGQALYAGCTFAEVEPYLRLNENMYIQRQAKVDYLAEMDSKYTIPIFKGLFGLKMTPGEMLENPTFQTFQRARHAILTNFINHVRSAHNLDQTVYVNISNRDFVDHGTDSRGDNVHSGELILQIANNEDNINDQSSGFYSFRGPIHIRSTADKDTGIFRTILNDQQEYQGVFDDLSSLNTR